MVHPFLRPSIAATSRRTKKTFQQHVFHTALFLFVLVAAIAVMNSIYILNLCWRQKKIAESEHNSRQRLRNYDFVEPSKIVTWNANVVVQNVASPEVVPWCRASS